MALIDLDTENWAQDIFGSCELGDKRLNGRLKQIASQLSASIGSSLASSCNGDDASLVGSYRFIRNDRVMPEQIAEGGYLASARKCAERKVILAIEDSTTLSFRHQIRDQLGAINNKKDSTSRGFVVHTSLLLDGETEKTIGIIDQHRWCRDSAASGQRNIRRKRKYEEKESYKWERNSRMLCERLGDLMPKVISVCDRESDIYEYMQYKIRNKQRFIVRCAQNRKLTEYYNNYLFSEMENCPILGEYSIEIKQKRGRKGRFTTIQLQAKKVTIMPPRNTNSKGLTPLTVNVVVATEKKCPKGEEKLQWILLTKEDISDVKKIRMITRYYELRWRIEDFHKAWKTGAGAERQRMQEANNLEKMVVILAFIAVRLLQLKEGFESREVPTAKNKETLCDTVLSKDEWTVLWCSMAKNKKPPKNPPTLGWAYYAIAQLGGWNDSKRTGKASWATVWKGWYKLQERLEGYKIFKNAIKM
jgi:hypothetical protein